MAEDIRVTVKLGSDLRSKVPDFAGGEGTVSLPAGATVLDLMKRLGIAPDEVNLIYRDHKPVVPEAGLYEGARVALFPPNFIHFSQFYIKRGT
ncbi:MAG: hypothetical protein Kow00129_12820 [Thermoleophilia bacterium]